jgi:ribonuclease HI
MTLFANTDGASRGNPGESGIGVILRDGRGTVVYEGCGYIGTATNNVAEYQALLHCLRKAREARCTKLVVHSDSELMVKQLRGEYRVRDSNLRKFHEEARTLIREAGFVFEIVHVERALNKEADLLANAGIEKREPLQV